MTRPKIGPNAEVLRLLIVTAALCTTAQAVEFAAGTGSPNDPYQIAAAEQLIALSDDPNLYDRHFVLVADIDLNPNLPGRRAFQRPVLTWSSPRRRGGGPTGFAGILDGQGHVIRNGVVFDLTDSLYSGFLAKVGPFGQVRNLHLEEFIIGTAGEFRGCATLVGENHGRLYNCSATGTVIAGSAEAGGLVARNFGVLVDCHARCNVFGLKTGGLVATSENTGRIVSSSADGWVYGSNAGGLVSTNEGRIQFCHTAGVVSGNYAAGLVATNRGHVRECYSLASALGPDSAALIGFNEAEVANCYAAGSAEGDGLVGANGGTIVSSYSTSPTQVKSPGGTRRRSLALSEQPIVADSDMAFTTSEAPREPYVPNDHRGIQYLYYLDVNETGDDPTTPLIDAGTPRSDSQMQQQAGFPGFDFYGDPNDGPYDTWYLPDDGHPVLTWQTEITGLSGIPDVNGLNLEQARDLLDASGFLLDTTSFEHSRSAPACYPDSRQVADCNEGEHVALFTHPLAHASPGSPVHVVAGLGPYDFAHNPGDGGPDNPFQISTAGQLESLGDRDDLWQDHFVLTADIDLAGRTFSSSLIQNFGGTFDGDGHAVRGLRIDRPIGGLYHGGLSGIIDPNALVCSLTLDRAHFRVGRDSGVTGILTGQNEGRVERCVVTGRILGCVWNAGGLAGQNLGHIADCQVRVRITAETFGAQIGGLVGENLSVIARCSVLATTVSGSGYVGGLVGKNFGPDASIEDCYAQGSVRGGERVGGLAGANTTTRLRYTRQALVAAAEMGARIRNCHTTCLVTGQDYTGGAVGVSVPDAVFEACYFLAPADGGGPGNGFGTPLLAVDLRRQASFPAWDFETTWTICEDHDFPRLQWEAVDCPQ